MLDRVTDAYFGVAQGQLGYLRDELGYPEHKIRVIRNGVDPTQFDGTDRGPRATLGFGERDLVVGILAALRPEKDHETFLQAARFIAAEVPEARFLIVGDGPQRSGLEALASHLGVADRVVFAGVRQDVPAILAAMDVFVLSSFTVECFPMALLEAMASSRPAVCTSVGGGTGDDRRRSHWLPSARQRREGFGRSSDPSAPFPGASEAVRGGFSPACGLALHNPGKCAGDGTTAPRYLVLLWEKTPPQQGVRRHDG
jgi:hypothetical protein